VGAAHVRTDFHRILLKQYHTIMRAWCEMDSGRRGRISFKELCRACHVIGYGGSARTLWEALDQDLDGFVTLTDIDAATSNLLESLAVCIWFTCGNVEAAWSKYFNKRGSLRCNAKAFLRGCNSIGFKGDVARAYDSLNIDLGTTGLTRKEFAALEMWFAPEPPRPIDVRHDKDVENSSARRPSLALPVILKKDPEADKKAFKDLLKRSYGNFVRAWREGLDRDDNGVLDEDELKRACADIGYAGLRSDLWKQLDSDNSGCITLNELDENTFKLLRNVYIAAITHYDTWENAWRKCMDIRGDDRVDIYSFTKGCRAWGYAGNAEQIFDLLDTDRAGYLSFAATSWIDGKTTKGATDVEGLGKFSGLTRAQARRMDFTGRDHRMRLARFDANARSDRVGVNVSPEVIRRSQSAAILSHPKGVPFPSDFRAIESIKITRRYPSSSSPSLGKKDVALEALATFTSSPSMDDLPLGARTKASRSVHSVSPLPSGSPISPGKGGWPASKLGLARIANKEWRESFKLELPHLV
jgi:hypothetical protein